MQVRAVHQQIGRAVPFLRGRAERQLELHLACVPGAVLPRPRLKGEAAHLGLEVERAQDSHGVRAYLNARPDAGERLGLLIDGDVSPGPVEQRCCRQTAHACAEDGDFRLARHVAPAHLPGVRPQTCATVYIVKTVSG
jgi:hypothetical protein